MDIKHIPILVNEILENIKSDYKIFFDGTLWHWWHARYILEKFLNIQKYIWVDRDFSMLEKAKQNLKDFQDRVIFVNNTYSNIDKISKNLWNIKFDSILLDLGVNMEHFKDSSRWFSIKSDWPLDMRFDKNSNFTAQDLVNTYTLDQFVYIFTKYWDFSEKFAKFLAQNIIDSRKKEKIKTTFQLKDILKKSKLNEREISIVFQTIRIQVNDELWHLEKFLNKFEKYLNIWWRCYIITFHSIEDRIVKNYFRQLVKWGNFRLVNKHVIKPTWQEVQRNRASRSAKLRIIERIV